MRSFSLFSFLFAFAILLDLAAGLWLRSAAHVGLVAACVLVVLRPASRAGLTAVAALFLAAFAIVSPVSANHHVLYAVASASVLWAGAAAAYAAGGPRGVEPGDWLQRFAPWLRAELLLLYFFAVLHKLNRDYFEPQVSCAVDLFVRVAPAWLASALSEGDATRYALIAGSLAAEAAIPLGLLHRRTRRLALAGGVLFHVLLGSRFYGFSTGVFAFYALFVPAPVLDRLAARWRSLRAQRPGLAWLTPGAARAACVALALGLALAWHAREAGFQGERAVAVGAGLVDLWAAGMLAAAALLLLAAGGEAWGAPPGRARIGLAVVFPLLLVLNGMAPYLGLRTAPAFSMFSNLRTEGGLTNHLFLPARALRVASYTDDLVVILAAGDPELERFAHRGRRRPFHQLKQRIQWMVKRGKRDISLTYRRGGRTIRVEHAESDPELMAEISWLERKLLRFRPLPIGGSRGCDW